jgi:uncharacterized membrane protein YgdD (TMEM256/DUF423 family)
MGRWFITAAAVSGFLAVAIGAFGAHGLKQRLSPDLMAVYQTGVQYHFWHTLALLAVGIMLSVGLQNRWLVASGGLFAGGIVLFSGSLYLLALTGIRGLGAITPLGGLLWLVAWACLAYGSWRITW